MDIGMAGEVVLCKVFLEMFLGFLGWAHQRTRIFRQRLLTRDPELFFRASVVGCARELVVALLGDCCFGLLPEPAEFFGDLATPLNAAGILQLAHDLLRLICVPIRVLTGLEHTNLIKRAPHDVLDEFLSAGRVEVCRAGWVGSCCWSAGGVGALQFGRVAQGRKVRLGMLWSPLEHETRCARDRALSCSSRNWWSDSKTGGNCSVGATAFASLPQPVINCTVVQAFLCRLVRSYPGR